MWEQPPLSPPHPLTSEYTQQVIQQLVLYNMHSSRNAITYWLLYTSGVRFQYFALRFCCLKNRGFGLGFVLFCFQLSASANQRTMNGFLCFNALQRWLSACVTLLMVNRSLNYTFNRDTRHLHDDEINCNCVWQCFINIYCLSNQPKKHIFSCECPFQMLWF